MTTISDRLHTRIVSSIGTGKGTATSIPSPCTAMLGDVPMLNVSQPRLVLSGGAVCSLCCMQAAGGRCCTGCSFAQSSQWPWL